jgi:hypothetical protein
MKKIHNSFDEELKVIRIELYEATKDMTPVERTEYFRQQAAPVNEEFGIKPIASAPRPLKLKSHNFE